MKIWVGTVFVEILTSQVEYVLILTILEFFGSWKIFCFLSRIFWMLLAREPEPFVDDSFDISHVFIFLQFSMDFQPFPDQTQQLMATTRTNTAIDYFKTLEIMQNQHKF